MSWFWDGVFTLILAMPIGFQAGIRFSPPPNFELREDNSRELREDLGYEMRQ